MKSHIKNNNTEWNNLLRLPLLLIIIRDIKSIDTIESIRLKTIDTLWIDTCRLPIFHEVRV